MRGMASLQTILGSGGSIGTLLARDLVHGGYTDQVRLVSRNPVKVNDSDELVSADLLDAEAVRQAVAGSSVVYLTVGFPYDLQVWRTSWPRTMDNVIAACATHNARLVFFDNIYMYGAESLDPIREDHPINPPSRKGAVRADILARLTAAMERGDVEATVARAADFYGPHSAANSMLGNTVIGALASGRRAAWLGNADMPHSFTFTPDAAAATALLGNRDEAYGQAWHLPTAPDPWTGRQWIEAAAKELDVKPRFQVAGGFILGLIGLFSPIMRELKEMLYQYNRPYVFSSEKFEKAFGQTATPYAEGLKQWIPEFRNG